MARVNLASYDVILVNTSAGKDSQTATRVVCQAAADCGVLDRVVAVHCDLDRVEWPGTRELAERQAAHYGVRFEVVQRKGCNLLERVLEKFLKDQAEGKVRAPWFDRKLRWCTSDFKRSPVHTLMTRLADETRQRKGPRHQTRILNVLGHRAQESGRRKKMAPFAFDDKASNSRRHVDTWLPIHAWTLEEVWANIRQSGVPYHPAYDAGMPRLSCVFCVYANRQALMRAGQLNRELLGDYVAVEQLTGYTFQSDLALADIAAALDAGETVDHVPDFVMC